MTLLSKTRRINSMLQAAAGKPVNFKDMAETLSEVIECNAFVVSRKGKVLGYAINQQIENERMKGMLEDRQFPIEYTQNLSNIKETSAKTSAHPPSIMTFATNRFLGYFYRGLSKILC